MGGVLSFDPETRRVWMFPRNIRDIAPWKLYKILKVLMQCEDINQYSGEEQKVMYDLLGDSGIKRPSQLRDKNPGGMRTYFSQLEALGLVFRAEGSDSYNYTLAGEALSNEENPLKVLQYQLLRHQYPSAYGLGQNVKIDPRMEVKPFMFLLRLLQDERLQGHLSNFDVVFPVIYGHNDDCYEFVVSKILEYRREGDFRKVIENWEKDLFTPRGAPENAIKNICDIANTAVNYLKAASLAVIDDSFNRRSRVVFNKNYEDLYREFLKESDKYLSIKTRTETQSFQRAYGRYLKSKDTRSAKECASITKESPSLQFATIKYIEYINDYLFSEDVNKFVAEMASYGISEIDSIAAVDKMTPRKRPLEENTYIDYALSEGVMSDEFEMATTNLMRKLGFTESAWIGSERPHRNAEEKFPNIFIKKANTKDCGLAGAKATSSYNLGQSDILKLENTYINAIEETEKSSQLIYFVYVAGGYKGDINKALSELKEAISLPVSAIDAKGMLNLLSKKWTPEEIEKKIFMSGEYISAEQIELM